MSPRLRGGLEWSLFEIGASWTEQPELWRAAETSFTMAALQAEGLAGLREEATSDSELASLCHCVTAALRYSVVRGTRYGSPKWKESTATDRGLQSTMRKPGRPKKQQTPVPVSPRAPFPVQCGLHNLFVDAPVVAVLQKKPDAASRNLATTRLTSHLPARLAAADAQFVPTASTSPFVLVCGESRERTRTWKRDLQRDWKEAFPQHCHFTTYRQPVSLIAASKQTSRRKFSKRELAGKFPSSPWPCWG